MIVIVGTNHQLHNPWQRTLDGASEGPVAFENMLSALLERTQARFVAEECSPDSLVQAGTIESIPQQLARTRQIGHCAMDPGRAARAELGILGASEIEFAAWMEGRNAAWVQIKRAAHFDAREKEWIRQLAQAPIAFPCVAVVGAEHVDGFFEKCSREGWKPTVEHASWEPPFAWTAPGFQG